MMTNRSRVVLYTGVTSKLEGRAWEHTNHVVEGFTSKYKVARLVYYEQFIDPLTAITREKEIKGSRREKKNKLVESLNPKWDDLTESLFGVPHKPVRSPHRAKLQTEPNRRNTYNSARVILNRADGEESPRVLIDSRARLCHARTLGEVPRLRSG